MNRLEQLKSELRLKRQAYESLRSDYELLKENVEANRASKLELRNEIKKLYAEYKVLKDGTRTVHDGQQPETNNLQ